MHCPSQPKLGVDFHLKQLSPDTFDPDICVGKLKLERSENGCNYRFNKYFLHGFSIKFVVANAIKIGSVRIRRT